MASDDLPDEGGPIMHTLQGTLGFGGNRYFLGLLKNDDSASADERQYILSKRLKRATPRTYVHAVCVIIVQYM